MFENKHLVLFFKLLTINKNPLIKYFIKGFYKIIYYYKLGKSPLPFVGKLVKPIK